MKDFINEHWRTILDHNGLSDFDMLWRLEAAWFEEPNHRRGGWSGVSRCELQRPDGSTCTVFLKRQENHMTRLWDHPVQGAPTFLREFRHIQRYREKGIATLEPVYFATRKTGKNHRAILITEELTGYISLDEHVQRWLKEGAPPHALRSRIIAAVATLLRDMHAHGIQHNCFFPKHIFTRINDDDSVDVRIIDLEKTHWRPTRTLCALRDLYTLNHQTLCWSRCDRMRFFKNYLQIEHLTPYAKWLWRRIESRSLKKGRLDIPERKLSAQSSNPSAEHSK